MKLYGIALFSLVLASCAPMAGSDGMGGVAGSHINISGFLFTPAHLTVAVGTTVMWTNNDPTVHTVTSNSGVFDSGDLANSQTFSFTFLNSGTYEYHCAKHLGMTGTIHVTN